MSAGCVRWLFRHTLRALGSRTPAQAFPPGGCGAPAALHPRSPFCTAADGNQETPAPPKKKKKQQQDPRARATIGSAGRRIQQKEVRVISDTGENLGVMHRSDALRLMDEQGLKLVLLREHEDPPVYRLMSGKQLHEEQMKLWEKQKAKAGPVQLKELSFSSGISGHDLATKLKQVQSWLEKKNHVRITLRSARWQTVENLDVNLAQIIQQMEFKVGFVNEPKVTKEGKAAMCVLRPPSAKELAKMKKGETPPPQKETPTTGNADAADMADTADAADEPVKP